MFAVATRAALKSVHRYRHGAIVTKGGAIVATGYNHGTTHAEVHALEKLWPSKRRGCSVWSIRLTGSGAKLANAKPCAACIEFMRANHVKRVYYSSASREIEMMRL